MPEVHSRLTWINYICSMTCATFKFMDKNAYYWDLRLADQGLLEIRFQELEHFSVTHSSLRSKVRRTEAKDAKA